MSINVDGGGSVEYADHEVQSIGVNLVNVDGTTAEGQAELDPVSTRGLDNDELAQLVGMYRYVNVTQSAASNAADYVAEIDLGINTNADSESFKDLSSQATVINEPSGAGDEFRVGVQDDPGILDGTKVTANSSANSGTTERFVDFKEFLGSGPYVDATDDLVINCELAGGDDTIVFEAGYMLYWAVEEMPEGRASFSRP